MTRSNTKPLPGTYECDDEPTPESVNESESQLLAGNME